MIVAMDQPTKADLRLVKQVLAPEVLRAFDRHTPRHRADHGHLSLGHVARCAERDQRLKPRLLECFQKLKLALVDVEQRVAVRTGDALGLVRRTQLEWTTTVWTTDLLRSDMALLFFGSARRGDAELGERDLLAQEDEWRRVVIIECAEGAVRAGQIGVVVSFTGREQVRDLALRPECGRASRFRHHQSRGPGQTGHLLPEF
jgi:hypothetical protein